MMSGRDPSEVLEVVDDDQLLPQDAHYQNPTQESPQDQLQAPEDSLTQSFPPSPPVLLASPPQPLPQSEQGQGFHPNQLRPPIVINFNLGKGFDFNALVSPVLHTFGVPGFSGEPTGSHGPKAKCLPTAAIDVQQAQEVEPLQVTSCNGMEDVSPRPGPSSGISVSAADFAKVDPPNSEAVSTGSDTDASSSSSSAEGAFNLKRRPSKNKKMLKSMKEFLKKHKNKRKSTGYVDAESSSESDSDERRSAKKSKSRKNASKRSRRAARAAQSLPATADRVAPPTPAASEPEPSRTGPIQARQQPSAAPAPVVNNGPEDPVRGLCSVCYERPSDSILTCCHAYCERCINEIKANGSMCPRCRAKFRSWKKLYI